MWAYAAAVRIEIYKIRVVCLLIVFLHAYSNADSHGFESPCPDVFKYNIVVENKEPLAQRWYGVVKLVSRKTLHSLLLNIVLDSKADVVGSWIGEVSTTDNYDFLIQNHNITILANQPRTVCFFVQYSSTFKPRVRAILLNGKEICTSNIARRLSRIEGTFAPMSMIMYGKKSNKSRKNEFKYRKPAPLLKYNKQGAYNNHKRKPEAKIRTTNAPTPTTTEGREGARMYTNITRIKRPPPILSYNKLARNNKRVQSIMRSGNPPMRKSHIKTSNIPITTFKPRKHKHKTTTTKAQTVIETKQNIVTKRIKTTVTSTTAKYTPKRQTDSPTTPDMQPETVTDIATFTSSTQGDTEQTVSITQEQTKFSDKLDENTQRIDTTKTIIDTDVIPTITTAKTTKDDDGSVKYYYGDLEENDTDKQTAEPTTRDFSVHGIQAITTMKNEPKVTTMSRHIKKEKHTTTEKNWLKIHLSTLEDGDDDDDETYADVPGFPTFFSARGENCGIVKKPPPMLLPPGATTSEGQWPWQVAIYQHQSIHLKYVCGGTLITKGHVVTAAHCVTKKRSVEAVHTKALTVYLGKFNLKFSVEGVQVKYVDRIIVHPDYNATTFSLDLALLVLRGPVMITDYVRVVCLWPEEDISLSDIVGHTGSFVGWSFGKSGSNYELSLKEMPIIDHETCKNFFESFYDHMASNYTYCARYKAGTEKCDDNESGGGMVLKKGKSWYLRGIVSVSITLQNEQRCDRHHYVVFTDLAKLLPWIKTHINLGMTIK